MPDLPNLALFGAQLAIVLIAARLFGRAAQLLRQPPVLGELLAGMALGAVPLPFLQSLRADTGLDVMAQIGVLLLLFLTGLESTVPQMLAVGGAALRVATIGVLVPFGLGWLVARAILPQQPMAVHAFLGATLTATSVGITARVLHDLGAAQTRVARIILGAAVIDDVLGLLLLAVVAAAIQTGGAVQASDILWIAGKAVTFLALALTVGAWLTSRLLRAAARVHPHAGAIAVAFGLCAALSWLAHVAGLAPIVGAFAAGLLLDNAQTVPVLKRFLSWPRRVLIPVFFVLMGVRSGFAGLLTPTALLLTFALIGVAILGKIVAGLGAGRGTDRLAVCLGMIPRGEVGLIFASIGQGLYVHGVPVVSRPTYAAVLTMIVVTTLVTPGLLRWRLGRVGRQGCC